MSRAAKEDGGPKGDLRLFWALELPTPVRDDLALLQRELKRSGADVRWVRPEGIHLTLKFLGRTRRELVPELIAAAGKAASACPPLSLAARAVGAFPRPAQPRVVWAGLEGDLAELSRLAAELSRAMAGVGFAPDKRPFSPHLTLGRVKSGRDKQALGRAMALAADHSGPGFIARELILFRSILAPAGAEYSVIDRLKLNS